MGILLISDGWRRESEVKYGRQVSSGGILFRPAGDGYEVALIELREGKVHALPKGLIDADEDPETTGPCARCGRRRG